MPSPIIVADFETALATAISQGSTSFSISSNVDDDGNTLPNGTYYFTLDSNTSSKEYVSGTLTGTAVSGVKTVSRQGVETSGAALAHRVGASVIITDFATYKKYMDAAILAGANPATTSSLGVVEMSVAPANASVPIAVGDNDPRVPSVTGVQFLSNVTGLLFPFAGAAAPSGFLLCDGSAVSRTTYAALFAVIGTTYGAGDGSTTFNVPDGRSRSVIGAGSGTKVATISSVAGNVITATGLSNKANNEFQTGQAVVFGATVAGNLVNATTYYVVRTGNATFSLATSLANAQNGTVITLAGTERGSLTLTLATRALGETGGEETHAMSAAELLAHSHVTPGQGSVDTSLPSLGYASNNSSFSRSTSATGGNAAMNNMHPFFVANWIIKT